jgi:hypothetical protein
MYILKTSLFFTIACISCVVAVGQQQKQTKQQKPLLFISVESEKENLTMPSDVKVASEAEVEKVHSDLVKQLGSMFEIVSAADKRDCFELGVVIEKLSTFRGTYYIGSTAITLARGDKDLLYTHNPVAEPSLVKFESAITFQLSSMVLQAAFTK